MLSRWYVLALGAGCAYKAPNLPDAGTDATSPLIDAPPGPCTLAPLTLKVATLSGCAEAGTNDGPRGEAHFANPVNVVLSESGIAYVAGALYVPEVTNGDIRKVLLDGTVTDLVPPHSLDQPQGIAADAAHTLYVTEWRGRSVKQIIGTTIMLIAGGNDGYLDSDTPTAAQFYALEGLDVSPDGHRIVVADGNHGDMSNYNHVRQISNCSRRSRSPSAECP